MARGRARGSGTGPPVTVPGRADLVATVRIALASYGAIGYVRKVTGTPEEAVIALMMAATGLAKASGLSPAQVDKLLDSQR